MDAGWISPNTALIEVEMLRLSAPIVGMSSPSIWSTDMTSYQRAKRIYLWRGSAIVLLGTTFVMLASAYVGQLTQ